MNLAWVRTLRSIIPIEYEYVARRGLLKLVPVRHNSAFDQVFHCCAWKTASQWVRLILSDPRVYAYSGLLPVPYRARLSIHDTSRRIFTPVYLDYPAFISLVKMDNHVTFFVLRDPRDLLVSWYFSNRYSHRLNPIVSKRRERLSRLSYEEGLLDTAHDFQEISSMMRSWIDAARQDPRIKLVRYEDLTSQKQLDIWAELFHHCDIRLPKNRLQQLLRSYSFEKMSGGRARGQEIRSQKYRKGVAGDWINHFTPSLTKAFVEWNGDIVERAGYAASGWWTSLERSG